MIGVFDSGIGGATVLKRILQLVPNYHYVYYSDSLNNPYGDKSSEEIYQIVQSVVQYLMDKGCAIIVIACNTASAICVNRLREEFAIPFVAIEPAYKMLHTANVTEKTLVMATKGTIESEKFQLLYQTYNNGNTILFPCIGLADLIEQGNTTEIYKYLQNHFKQFEGVKHVVLGCTHYPLIKEQISSVLGEVTFYDGSFGVAAQLKHQIEQIHLMEETSKIDFFDSSNYRWKEERFWEILKNEKF